METSETDQTDSPALGEMDRFDIREVVALPGYRLRLTLGDGSVVERALETLLHGPVLGPLRDERLFARVEAVGGSVSWPTGAEICDVVWGRPAGWGRGEVQPERPPAFLARFELCRGFPALHVPVRSHHDDVGPRFLTRLALAEVALQEAIDWLFNEQMNLHSYVTLQENPKFGLAVEPWASIWPEFNELFRRVAHAYHGLHDRAPRWRQAVGSGQAPPIEAGAGAAFDLGEALKALVYDTDRDHDPRRRAARIGRATREIEAAMRTPTPPTTTAESPEA